MLHVASIHNVASGLDLDPRATSPVIYIYMYIHIYIKSIVTAVTCLLLKFSATCAAESGLDLE
jgi:hypothetical protein